ncbi:hypothetical protein IT396_00145 [Candidatus Nomurabacteria bacterium]|nr:hypothetical protein [Candidatus Nomurabacteria bacterium]
MAVNAEVRKNDAENDVNLIRRFSKRVQGVGLIQGLRKRRYHARDMSSAVRRKKTLKAISRREYVQEQIKLGKMEVRTGRSPRRK